MRLRSLTLESFRSYPDTKLNFENGDEPCVLLGDNATGKTNIIEAISMLATLKSQRKAEDADMIAWNRTHYRVAGAVVSDSGEEKSLEVVSQIEPRKQRAFFINGVRTPAHRYVGTLPLVIFAPDELALFTGPPGARRRFMDDLLRQVSPGYLQASSEYEKCIKQRNSLLKQIRNGEAGMDLLDVWDEKIATLGAVITIDRLQLFEALQMTILRELKSLGENPQFAEFKYIRKGTGKDDVRIRGELLEQLIHYRERDIIMAATTTGPHRDDWTLRIDGRDIAGFASRGQQRSALLALLLLQASFLNLHRGEKPVLLLDDIFSEFDGKHRTAVLHSLSKTQVIITSVELDKDLRGKTHVMACPLQ